MGKFLCLLWQHCRRPWSFTCEPCSFDSDRTGFVWVRRVWNGSSDPKSRQMRGAFRRMISERKSERSEEIYKQIVAVYGNVMNRQNVTKWWICLWISAGHSPFALRNLTTERTSHLVGLWIGAAISNTSHSNKAGSTTFKRARLTGKGSMSTAVLPQ